MRVYTGQHQHYGGIDLYARTLYLCVLDAEGNVLLHKNLPCDRTRFLEAIAPFREDMVVASECIFNWYWLADLCAEQDIHFVLGHALYMRAIHGAKAKNDRIDSHKTTSLLKGGLLPQAYAYPSQLPSRIPSSVRLLRLTWPSARPTTISSGTSRTRSFLSTFLSRYATRSSRKEA